MEQLTTPTTTEGPKRKCATPAPAQPSTSANPTKNIVDSNIKQAHFDLPPEKKRKKSTPLRVSIPNEDDCKLRRYCYDYDACHA